MSDLVCKAVMSFSGSTGGAESSHGTAAGLSVRQCDACVKVGKTVLSLTGRGGEAESSQGAAAGLAIRKYTACVTWGARLSCSSQEEEEEQRAAKGQLQDFLSGNAEVKEAKARARAAQQAADLIQLAQTSPMEASQMAAKRQQLAKVRGGCDLPELPILLRHLRLESTFEATGKSM